MDLLFFIHLSTDLDRICRATNTYSCPLWLSSLFQPQQTGKTGASDHLSPGVTRICTQLLQSFFPLGYGTFFTHHNNCVSSYREKYLSNHTPTVATFSFSLHCIVITMITRLPCGSFSFLRDRFSTVGKVGLNVTTSYESVYANVLVSRLPVDSSCNILHDIIPTPIRYALKLRDFSDCSGIRAEIFVREFERVCLMAPKDQGYRCERSGDRRPRTCAM